MAPLERQEMFNIWLKEKIWRSTKRIDLGEVSIEIDQKEGEPLIIESYQSKKILHQ